ADRKAHLGRPGWHRRLSPTHRWRRRYLSTRRNSRSQRRLGGQKPRCPAGLRSRSRSRRLPPGTRRATRQGHRSRDAAIERAPSPTDQAAGVPELSRARLSGSEVENKRPRTKEQRRFKNEGRVSRKEIPDPGPRLGSTWSEKSCLVARVRIGGSVRSRSARTVARQTRKERRNFKRHLVTRRSDGDRSRLHHLDLIGPGIDLDASAQRQGRDLIELAHIQGGPLGCQRGKTIDGSVLSQRIAQVCRQQRAQRRSPSLQYFQEQPNVIQFLR